MSTRVDKGGPKFKPILKSKARPSATPAPPDARVRSSIEPSLSMPPPSFIPERTPSVAPSSEPAVRSAPNSVATGRPSVPQIQSSKPKPAGNVVVTPSARPATIHPTRTVPPIQSSSGQGAGASLQRTSTRPVISIASTSSAAAPSQGTPILPSRATPGPSSASGQTPVPTVPAPAPPSTQSSTIAPPTSSSKGKKRAAAPETEDQPPEDERSEPAPSIDSRGGVARKRPKLAIVQAEEDRVKRPRRTAKGKKKAVVRSEATEGEEDGASEAEPPKKKRAPRKKKTADENADEGATADPSHPGPKRTRARRKATQESADDDADAGPHESESQSESATPKKKRKKRQRTETVEPEGTPEPIDPTQVTMSVICDDPGSGRMSSRWETSQVHYAEARKRAREDRERAIAEAVEEERETGRAGARKGVPRPTLPTASEAGEESVTENTGANPDEFTYDETLQESHYAPQVRIGANGEVVLDVESLQVDRAANTEAAEDAYSFVEESDQSKFTNSNSWSKRRSVRWGKEDTAMFYEALRQFGQNFDLIARVLPGRTYRMCKNKFKAEDKKNSALIDDALKNGVAVDIGTLSRMTGKDFSGPTPVIVAKKAPDLGEHDEPAERPETDLAEESVNAPGDSQLTGADDDQTGGGSSEAQVDTRQSESPPPPESLLTTLGNARQSTSPPPARSVLDASGSANPSATRSSGPIAISAPKRNHAVRQALEAQDSAPAQDRNIVEPSAAVKKKKGRKKAAAEEGVEVLGLVQDYVDD